jgi:mRNA-degrading endonuclease RelE of RelBE toxin-antitoxin system
MAMAEAEQYRIEGSDEYLEGFEALPAGHQRRVKRFVDQHLRHAPGMPISGMKALRGQHRGLYQFMVSMRHGTRLLYRIDEEQKVVRLEYCGSHPSWSPTRARGNVRNL